MWCGYLDVSLVSIQCGLILNMVSGVRYQKSNKPNYKFEVRVQVWEGVRERYLGYLFMNVNILGSLVAAIVYSRV